MKTMMFLTGLFLCVAVPMGFTQGWVSDASEVPEVKITVSMGDEDLPFVPMVVSVDEKIPYSEPVILTDGSMEIAALPLPSTSGDGGTDLAFVLEDVEANQTLTLTLKQGRTTYSEPLDVDWGSESIEFNIGGFPFTEYHYIATTEVPRPIFYPLYGPEGVRMTRSYPMNEREGEATDHPHHQSLWVSHGDVNGVNFWHLDENQGMQVHQDFNYFHASPIAARFSQTVWWQDAEGTPLIEEERIITVWGSPEDMRFIDFDMTYNAVNGPVVFGDTKEGGLVSLRVASTMRERPLEGNTPGLISNSEGQQGESNAWGKPAPWCDYSGLSEDLDVGLTILCHPENPLDTYYHVRGYGLFTANPFGLSYFYNDENRSGSQTLEPDEPWRFRYRVYIHAGNAEDGQVAAAFAAYADGVTVSVE